ncbi:MAG TPA: outer membrane beta-barrel protein [Bacteroidales bacterium]|nr:outer membrane beta-barrel protein [Bacteroidales bacterium]HPR56753.1 outer membrane beta-barrel protein [Bacteroidales bacterium]
MKKVILILMLIIAGFESYAQNLSETTRKKFSTIIDVYNDFYLNIPDSVSNRLFNPGAGISGLYDFRFGKSNFSFAIGGGISSHNFHSNSFTVVDENGVTSLKRIKSLYPSVSNYERNKISFTYFDIPMEFRLRTKKNIRAAIGFKFGFLLESHSKYRGDDYLYNTTNQLFVKFKDVENIQDLRYGLTARFGWKFINLTGFYSFSNIFEEDKGPDIYPFSVGISLMPF